MNRDIVSIGLLLMFVSVVQPRREKVINVALETVLSFDENDTDADIKFINKMQDFLKQVQNKIEGQKKTKPLIKRRENREQYKHKKSRRRRLRLPAVSSSSRSRASSPSRRNRKQNASSQIDSSSSLGTKDKFQKSKQHKQTYNMTLKRIQTKRKKRLKQPKSETLYRKHPKMNSETKKEIAASDLTTNNTQKANSEKTTVANEVTFKAGKSEKRKSKDSFEKIVRTDEPETDLMSQILRIKVNLSSETQSESEEVTVKKSTEEYEYKSSESVSEKEALREEKIKKKSTTQQTTLKITQETTHQTTTQITTPQTTTQTTTQTTSVTTTTQQTKATTNYVVKQTELILEPVEGTTYNTLVVWATSPVKTTISPEITEVLRNLTGVVYNNKRNEDQEFLPITPSRRPVRSSTLREVNVDFNDLLFDQLKERSIDLQPIDFFELIE